VKGSHNRKLLNLNPIGDFAFYTNKKT